MAVNTIETHEVTLSCLVFCFIHETAHLAAMWLVGAGVSEIKLYGGGIKITGTDIESLPASKRLFVYLSGCAANLILAAVFMCLRSTLLVVINICIAAFNLLPIYYFDGGMVLKTLFCEHESVLKILSGIAFALVIAMAAASLVVTPYSVSFSALITVLFVAVSELFG